jgi:hypothetical protein
VDVVELLGEDPFIFCIINFEAAVGRDTKRVLIYSISVQKLSKFRGCGRQGMEGTNKAGWIGLKSVPNTLADGKAEAKKTN